MILTTGVAAQRLALRAIEDESLRTATIDTFAEARRRASAGEIDLVVLAARRLACLYQVLVNAGMERFDCEVVSDRVLSLDDRSKHLGESSSVLIIDDCVILGRTLTSLVSTVRDRVPETTSVEAVAICVDKDQVLPGLMQQEGITVMCERSTTETQRFSVAVARSLFINLVPYFADFPSTRVLPLTALTYSEVLQHGSWQAVETTPQQLREPGQAAYSLIPDDAVMERFRSRVGDQLASLVTLLKVRIFVRFDGSRNEFVAVPLGLVRGMSVEELNGALEAISDEIHTRSRTGTNWQGWNAEAKLRLLQSFFSVILLQEFWRDMAEVCPDLPALEADLIDADSLSVHYGSWRLTALTTAISQALLFTPPAHFELEQNLLLEINPDPIGSDPRVRESLQLARTFFAKGKRVPSMDGEGVIRLGEMFAGPIAGVFGFINELERRSRRRERKRALAHSGSIEPSGMRWLNEGLSLRALQSVVPHAQAPLLVSLAIDVCNDLGIAVPTTHHDESGRFVYRRYRIGENAFLGTELGRRARRRHQAGANLAWLNQSEHWLVRFFFTVSAPFEDVVPSPQPTRKPAAARALLSLLDAQIELADSSSPVLVTSPPSPLP